MPWKFSDAFDSTVALPRTSMWTVSSSTTWLRIRLFPLDTWPRKTMPINKKQNQWGHGSHCALNWLYFPHSRGAIEFWNWLYFISTVSWGKTYNLFQLEVFRQSRLENVYSPSRTLRNCFNFTNMRTLHYWIFLSYIPILWSQTDPLPMGTQWTGIILVLSISTDHNKIPES